MSVEAQHGYLKLLAENSNFQFQKIVCSGAAHGDNDYKEIFPGSDIVFVDMVPGDGIDYAWNLEESPPKELENSCDLFISTSVLEHVEKPWLAAKNIMKTLSNKGLVFITVPWAWEYHAFPRDYWRMSPDALDVLFDGSTAMHTAWVTYPDGIGYRDWKDLPAVSGSYAEGKNFSGSKCKARIHPIVQIFQVRQKNEIT